MPVLTILTVTKTKDGKVWGRGGGTGCWVSAPCQAFPRCVRDVTWGMPTHMLLGSCADHSAYTETKAWRSWALPVLRPQWGTTRKGRHLRAGLPVSQPWLQVLEPPSQEINWN